MVASLYDREQEKQSIWVYLEQDGQALESVSLELLSKGRQLADEIGWQLVGLLLGSNVSHMAETAIYHGADEVISADHPLLDSFTVEAYTHITHQSMLAYKPSVFLLGATPNGRDLAGRLAVRLRTGLNADCTDLKLQTETGILVCEVSGFGGGVLALIEMENHRPQMATVRPGVFPITGMDPKRKGILTHFPFELKEETITTQVIERRVGESVDLTQTPVLVAGGRGVGGNFTLLEELATLLGGDVGGTRPPVDDGFIDRERQIGQTGVVCRPKIAIVCGVSGAFHFVVGIQDADLVIAVNSDPEAPIFEYADYCIVDDVFQVLPALIAALRPIREVSYA